MSSKQKITTFLWFDRDAEEAARHYTSIFEGSRIVDVAGSGGSVQSVTFELAGQQFFALNGGPTYRFSPAISLFVSVETQDELDRIWDRLLEGGGKPTRCGWLEDRFGLSWQVIPTILGALLRDPDRDRAGRAVQAMLGMQKLDITALEKAHAGG